MAHIAGTIMIGAGFWIDVGAVAVNDTSVSPDRMIGAGATVVKSITEAGAYIVTPARKIK